MSRAKRRKHEVDKMVEEVMDGKQISAAKEAKYCSRVPAEDNLISEIAAQLKIVGDEFDRQIRERRRDRQGSIPTRIARHISGMYCTVIRGLTEMYVMYELGSLWPHPLSPPPPPPAPDTLSNAGDDNLTTTSLHNHFQWVQFLKIFYQVWQIRLQWRIQDFPEGASIQKVGVKTYHFGHSPTKTAWNFKRNWIYNFHGSASGSRSGLTLYQLL